MKSSTTMDAQACRQLIMKADTDLVAYQSHIAQAEKAVAAAIAELDVIGARSDGRQQALQLADQTVRQLQSELDQARTRATLAQGTLAASTGEVSTKDLERRLQKAERDLAVLSTRLSKEEFADAERARSAQANREKYETQLDYFQRQTQTLLRVREEAQRDLGECEYEQVLDTLNDLQSNLADKEEEVTRAQSELDDFADEAKEQLSSWPDLLEQVKPHLPYHDNTTLVLSAAIDFLNVCLKGRDAADIDPFIFRDAGLGQFVDLFAMLSFERDDYHGILKGSGFEASLGGPPALQERRDQLSKLLQVYRDARR